MDPKHERQHIGELAAELFLRRLGEQGFRSSNRHIVDYLPTEVGHALFTALLSRTHEAVDVRLPDDHGGDRIVPMRAVRHGAVDVLPYLVTAIGDPTPTSANCGSEGYASCLRDHYAIDAQRSRLLVVITNEGNETQKSARDAPADLALVTLEQLLQEVLDRSMAPPDSPLRRVAEVYRAHQDERAPWARVVEDFERYVETVVDAAPEQQGAQLPMLKCFLPDARPDFASGEPVRILEDKDQRRRQRGEGRLYDNALLYEFLQEAFADPVTDPEHVLADVFEDQAGKALEIARKGVAGLRHLDIGTFAGMEQRRQKREKNSLERASVAVVGAAYHRLFGQEDDSILVVTSAGPFTVTFKLGRPFNSRKEHAQLGTWSSEKNKLALKIIPTKDGSTTLEIPVEPDPASGFSVARVALTRGPRSLRSPIDAVLIVVYHSASPEIVVEEGRLVSLDDQAWIAEGKRSFQRYTAEGTQPVEIADEEPVDAARDPDVRPVFQVLLSGSELLPRVVDERPTETDSDDDDGRYAYESTLELACSTVRRGHRTTAVMRNHENYLDAVREIHEGLGRYKVDLDGGDMREIWAHHEGAADPFRTAQAVAQLVTSPLAVRIEWRAAPKVWTHISPPDDPPPSIVRFLDARAAVLVALRELAEKTVPRFRRVPSDAALPLFLLPLHRIGSLIEALLRNWNEAVDDTTDGVNHFGAWHDVLLQTDTLRIVDDGGAIERLIVLPTHPWLLAALVAFQTRFARNVHTASERKGVVNSWHFELTRGEVQQMLPRAAVEDWYFWQSGTGRLSLVDSRPFHLEFRPEAGHVHRNPLDYVGKVVANKVSRYLRMHPHLRDERRTLRIGFVNPGTGQHMLHGLEQWLRATMREHAGRIRDLPTETIPAVDVLLFSDDKSDGVGTEFERFFREQVTGADEDVIRQTLLARMQYRFCSGRGPAAQREAVHICFVHGLVDARKQHGKTGLLSEWWDGGFGDGLLATYLRRTLAAGTGQSLHSRRGIWVDPGSSGLRGGLARMMALQRGCRDSDLSREKAIYWETPLPDLQEMAPTYKHSDWVVHLDRELSLEIFRRGSAPELPTIIEYTDQEVPDSPGYDTITATRNAAPYREQLGEILTTADLDIAGRSQAAQKAANAILDDINVLSGSWALDFLLGSIADQRTSMRLKGNVGAALVYRWLRRMEMGSGGSSVTESNVGPVVPVLISLEDLLRATPATGLSRKDGLVYRYTNEIPDRENKEAARWCDDLLVMYLTRTENGTPSRLFGRVIEVKFGKTASGARDKAIGQVQNTHQLLQERLAGDDTPLDAPFRHKQLSLLIKAQLEQAVAMRAHTSDIYDFLNVPALSANLATGRYYVDYTIGSEGKHLAGDAFLLDTTLPDDQIQIDSDDDVRVVTVPRKLVEWLAFELDDSPTLTTQPQSTFPRLGRYKSVVTQTGGSQRHLDLLTGVAATSSTTHDPLTPTHPAIATVSMLSESIVAPVENEEDEQRGLDPPIPTPAHEDVQPRSATQEASISTDSPNLDQACLLPIKAAPYPDGAVVDAVLRLERALTGHKVRLTSSPSPRETARGPRLLRVYVRLGAGESINAVRRISEDIARAVGTAASDIHITNVPERHAVGLDLPLPGLTYAVSFDELMAHPSFDAAQRELRLGFCAGIDVTGRPVWTDLAGMPHMLVAGTTGSGKTVFLRNLVLTLLLNNSPAEMLLRLSSSKPMDFRAFTQAPHARGREMARDPDEARLLADELVEEMERRYQLLDQALCDNLGDYNEENPASAQPYIVAVFDEYAEMVASFGEKSDRDAFEAAVGRLAQKARAAGIHLVICMQRPDANALKGAIKANILHRFALKLPQNHDSRIILDESGAETLLGQGDLLYKDANGRLHRLQVPFLENATLKRNLMRVIGGGCVRGVDEATIKTCPKCGRAAPIGELFGMRRMRSTRRDGTEVIVERPQSYCRDCRAKDWS